MNVFPIVPDQALEAPVRSAIPAAVSGGAAAFGQLVDAAGSELAKADAAETAFARGRGGLQEMVVERARADITLAVAAGAAQRAAQSLNTLLGMQV